MSDLMLRAAAAAERGELDREVPALKLDIACRPDSLDLLYRIREGLGFNSYYPLSNLDSDAKRQRDALLNLAKAVVDEYENLEDRAPVHDDCGQCTTWHLPHKRICAYHQAKYVDRWGQGMTRRQRPLRILDNFGGLRGLTGCHRVKWEFDRLLSLHGLDLLTD